ncbi:C4-dicarboxylate TRAP transporter substrate-binding protein [Salinisphaera aquimarina]|uniref:C4-dicarboxylate TRAP transporter substrate-binding protein n=1 Tax=Salinisphaera aquimarina TaxID=2094031 RepID=A0ABV7ELR1_9GAMM
MRASTMMTALLVLLTVGMCGASHAAERFVYGSYVPRSHTFHTAGLEPYFEAVRKDSDGEMRFRLLSDGTVVDASNTLTGIRNGTVDMGLIVDVYIPSTLPTEATINELALFADNTTAAAAAMTEMVLLHCPQCQSEWKKAGVTPIAFYSTSPYYLMCKTPISDLASLKGKRIKSATAWNGLAAHFGATPVSLATSETYEAMSRGQVDCALAGAAYLKSYGLADIVKYIVDMPMGSYMGATFIDMNTERWQALTDDQRKLFIDHAAEAIVNVSNGYDADAEESLTKAHKDGVKFIEPGAPLTDSYDAYLEKERKRVAALAEKRGVKDPENLVTTYLDLLSQWTKIVEDADGDKATLVEAINKRIYAKADL